jgi:hypothetical protein
VPSAIGNLFVQSSSKTGKLLPMNLLSAWQNFYVIVGTAGGALIGIQFVVIALVADSPRRTDTESIHAFGTPTVVHFGATLAIAAILCAPWPSLYAISVALLVLGLAGIGYAIIVFRRALRQKAYKPVAEDWIWYVILPCGAYAAMAVGAALLSRIAEDALFIVAAGAISLLFIGIHNAWDTVTYIVTDNAGNDQKRE